MTTEVLDSSVKQTALFTEHEKAGAKLIPFGGYLMPVSYPAGIMHEYFAVRNSAGLFDVSHMGEFFISGEGALEFLQEMTINDVSNLQIGEAQYSAMCHHDGGIIDDLIIYRKEDGFFMVVNASNIDKDFNWLQENLPPSIRLEDLSDNISLIALQGPDARNLLSTITDADLQMKFYTFTEDIAGGHPVMISRTGYTGELGYELYGSHDAIVSIWQQLIAAGATPAGLAARDILRMEMKYCLYGNDIDQSTNPIEAGLSWITATDKTDFIGKKAIMDVKTSKPFRRLVTFTMLERGIPRQGYEVWVGDEKVGRVTSGTQSPYLKTGIGLAYIQCPHHTPGTEVSLKIRDKLIKGKVVKPPFVKETSLHH
ncbi:MAG: glycine cleavage system aminomethyltransferase GcvT [Candidatus Marinimicrobia bacterium]|jgi:aminomethyltransferase|nr:glycine cleavage system aminomethyltransferase GcvT [Candidatus Neomarinimicrobiota bacterium]